MFLTSGRVYRFASSSSASAARSTYQRLAPELAEDAAMGVSGGADHLEVGIRASVLPAAVQARVIARRHTRTPLTATEAGDPLRLIRAELLRPVNPTIAGLDVNHDLMFALGLVNQPATHRSRPRPQTLSPTGAASRRSATVDHHGRVVALPCSGRMR